MTTRILDIALNSMWAMEEPALMQLLDIAGRQHTVDTAALEAYRAKSLEKAERTTYRDGVAIMNIEGALFPKANLMTDLSGATSYDILRRDLQAVIDKGCTTLLLNVDSPGGAVKGCSEFAQALFEAREKLTIVAYVGGTCASAAYFIASAAHRIVVNDQAELGSIGCMMTLRTTADRAGEKTYEFISSQSPNKNIDPATAKGAKSYQDRVDAMAGVFYETVARNRGVATETALKNFGKGGMFVGKDAVQAGLADSVGSFEATLAEYANGKKPAAKANANKGTSTRMSDKTELKAEQTAETVASATPAVPAIPAAPVVDVNAAVAAALAADRSRMAGIDTIAAAHGVAADVVAKAKTDGTDVAAFALQVAELTAAATKKSGDEALASLRKDETTASQVGPSTSDETTEVDEVDALAKRIAAA